MKSYIIRNFKIKVFLKEIIVYKVDLFSMTHVLEGKVL